MHRHVDRQSKAWVIIRPSEVLAFLCGFVCSFARSLVRSPHANEERHEPVALDLVRQELPEGEFVPVDRRHCRSNCDTLLLLLGRSLPSSCVRVTRCCDSLKSADEKTKHRKIQGSFSRDVPKAKRLKVSLATTIFQDSRLRDNDKQQDHQHT